MNQMDLFENQGRAESGGEARKIAIHSGRVGAIRFGATETSFTMTRDALTDLAALPDGGADETA